MLLKKYELDGPILFLISGKKQHGKDTFGNDLGLNITNPYFIYKLAEPIKAFFSSMGLDYSDLEGANKEKVIPEYGKSPRQLMIEFGQAVRAIHQDIFTAILFKTIQSNLTTNPVFFITDVRFKNEIKYLEKHFTGRILKIRINRTGMDDSSTDISEVDLDDYQDWDFVINNDKGLCELKDTASNLIYSLGYFK